MVRCRSHKHLRREQPPNEYDKTGVKQIERVAHPELREHSDEEAGVVGGQRF